MGFRKIKKDGKGPSICVTCSKYGTVECDYNDNEMCIECSSWELIGLNKYQTIEDFNRYNIEASIKAREKKELEKTNHAKYESKRISDLETRFTIAPKRSRELMYAMDNLFKEHSVISRREDWFVWISAYIHCDGTNEHEFCKEYLINFQYKFE